MSPLVPPIWAVVFLVCLAFWAVVLENAYWTWFRPWLSRRRWERRTRKRGRHW